jgi:hypothetical protein
MGFPTCPSNMRVCHSTTRADEQGNVTGLRAGKQVESAGQYPKRVSKPVLEKEPDLVYTMNGFLPL